MCFGGGGGVEYEKPDFGPLPSLREDDSYSSQTPVYRGADRRTGMRTGTAARTFFVPREDG